MTILCHGSTHVYLTGHARCTCGAAANGYPPTAGMMASTGHYVFQGYNPFSPHAPAKSAPDVPLAQFKAAKDAGGLYLSADGLRTYRDDRGGPEVAHWDAEAGRFDSWWNCPEGLAPDAAAL